MALRDVQAVVTITTNATKAIDDGKKLRETYQATLNIIKQFRKDGKIDTPEGKELLKLADDLQAKIKTLVTGMKLIDGITSNLANKTGKDINRALRETSKEFNKTANDTDNNKAKLERLRESVAKLKREMSDRRGLTMSFQDAQKQLSNLNKTSLDNLNKGLATIKEQLANPLPNKWRQQLEAMQAQYQAAIVTRQAPVTTRPVTTMNAAQLRAEQSAITAALSQTAGVKGFEQQAANYKKRLQEITQELKNISSAEKQAEERARQLQATQQAAQTVQAVYREQQVSLEQLNTAYKTLEELAARYNGVNPAKFRKTQEQMDMLRTKIQQVSGQLLTEEELQKRMANMGEHSVNQLQQAYQQLQTKLNNLATGEKVAIEATRKQMKMLERQIQSATGKVSGMAKAWQTAKQNVAMYVGVFAIVNKVKSTLSELVSQNKALSDSMANIRKVSQWTSKDVVALTENLAKIDTRNTITTLQNLAYQGAKLGIGQYGVEGLTGFVKAAEQVQTALGEDLGEEALPALAKLTEVMGLIPKFGVEQAMQKAGSAIYQLGATSTATGKNIVEFSKRLMGLANVSGVSADQLLGLGAAADTMALMPEVAATAFNKLFNSIQSNTAGIAKAVGLAKEDLQSLIYEGQTMEALVKVFEKMQTMSMAEMEGRGVFKELGSDGARLTNVMITMASKVDMLKKSLQTSNEAFSEGRAVINEYMIQQETAAAYFERASNIWAKAFVNPEGVDIVKQLAQEWYNVSYEMTHSASTMAGIKLTLELLAGMVKQLITYLPTLIQLMMAHGVGSALQSVVVQYKAITAAATAAGGATARFNALLKTNAISLAITGVAMLGMKLYELSEASKAAAAEEEKRQRVFSDAAAEALQQYNDQAKALEKYDEALKKSNITEDERNNIIKQFKDEFGTYLEKLGIEINTYNNMTGALKRVNKELKDKAFYETGQKLRESYVGDARSSQTNAISQYMQAAQKYNLPTTLMEDIIEGRFEDQVSAVRAVYDYLYGAQYGVNGHLRWSKDSRTPYQYTISENDHRSAKPLENKGNKQTEEIYNVIADLFSTTQEVSTRDKQVDDFLKQYLGDGYKAGRYDVQGALVAVKELKKLNDEQLNDALNVLRDEWKKMSEEDRKTDRGKEIGSAIDQYSKQIRSLRGEGYTPPPTAKEIRAAESEEKQALRKDLQDAKTESDAIISKVEEWYRLQETVINDMQADGRLTKEQADQAVRTLNIAKNEALRDARLAISGRDTKSWEVTKRQIGDLMLDQGKWSQELLTQILGVSMDGIRRNLARIDKGGGKYGITTSSLKDAIDKNAAGNQREIARLMAKGQEEVQKLLDQYHFVEQAMKGFSDRLAQMGILTETARNLAVRLADASNPDTLFSMKDYESLLAGNEQAKRDTLQAFIQSGTAPYAVNPEDTEELRRWFMDFVGTFQEDADALGGVAYQYNSWAEPFRDDFEQWLRDSETYKDRIQQFYFSLMQSSDQYYKAQRQQYEFYKKQNETLWENSGRKEYYDQIYTQLGNQQQMQDVFGTGQSFGQQYGFADAIANDPEVELYKQKLQAAAEYFQFVESHQHTEQELREAQQDTIEAYMAMAKKVTEEVAERASKIQELTAPASQFAEDVGQKWGDMLFDMESSSDTWNAIVKKMILSFAQMTIKMAAENLTKKIQQALFYKQMQAMEVEHQTTLLGIQTAFGAMRIGAQQTINTTGQTVKSADDATTVSKEVTLATILTQLGISEGAAKTIGKLGWWGIPLVAVISSLLLGLLSSALSTAKKSSETSNNTNNTKIKLVSGMLTYDEGNVQSVAVSRQQSYLGTDGHVYRATPDAAPKTGLVTQPIATTVQGNPALVAERGPEIVIGRKTTKRIMMNEPALLRHLQNIDAHSGYTPYLANRRALRTYDDGTGVPYTAVPQQPADDPTADAQLTQTLTALTAAVLQLQQSNAALQQRLQQPIRAEINKYGTGGLIDEVKSGLKFDSRYSR